uniref:Cullin domain-containing protein n=1 Tax=Heterorhabditis bacteriophora TaxID=37862 RepID=A0A1I7XAY4_HETBA
MYHLLKPIPSGLLVMVKEFEDYVRKKGLELVSGLSGDNVPQQFVDNVHEKYNTMKTEVFGDDGDFAGALDKALQSVVNVKEGTGPPKSSERYLETTKATVNVSMQPLILQAGSWPLIAPQAG